MAKDSNPSPTVATAAATVATAATAAAAYSYARSYARCPPMPDAP